MTAVVPADASIGAQIEACAQRLLQAGVYFGHGTDNAVDEAAALVLHAAGLRYADADVYAQALGIPAKQRLEDYLQQRIELRRPTPYITGEAWFGGLRFAVDDRVLIPRSPFAELIGAGFAPWLRPGPVERILEVGTGCGCMAIAAAYVFPESHVLATDLSPGAMAVAAENRQVHGLEQRLSLVQADLLSGITGPFDVIMSNPPYVAELERERLPPEYAHEPVQALFTGDDGLESPKRILQDAARLLADDGLLLLEVGAGWPALEAEFPSLPFVWPELLAGGEGIAVVYADDLRRHGGNTS